MFIALLLASSLLGQPSDTSDEPEPELPVRLMSDRFDEDCKVLSDLTVSRQVDALASELKRLDQFYAAKKDTDLRSVAFARFLSAIQSADGGLVDPAVRKICRPYVESIVTRELPVGTLPVQHEAQLLVFVSFMRDGEQRRRETIQALVKIWERVDRSWAIYEPLDPEGIVSGEVTPEKPEFPKSLIAHVPISGLNPSSVTDPKARQEYEAYLKRVRDFHNQLRNALDMWDLRKRYVEILRPWLTDLYGKNPKEWTELREVITETVKDETTAVRVRRDLTNRRK